MPKPKKLPLIKAYKKPARLAELERVWNDNAEREDLRLRAFDVYQTVAARNSAILELLREGLSARDAGVLTGVSGQTVLNVKNRLQMKFKDIISSTSDLSAEEKIILATVLVSSAYRQVGSKEGVAKADFVLDDFLNLVALRRSQWRNW